MKKILQTSLMLMTGRGAGTQAAKESKSGFLCKRITMWIVILSSRPFMEQCSILPKTAALEGML